MFKTAWDAFLSLVILAVFTIALFGGVNWLVWTYEAWRTNYWKEEGDEHKAQLCFLLAGVATLVGLMGSFRRGTAEKNFSMVEVGAIATGAATGHVHIPAGHAHGRTLRRFPSFESVVLGVILITIWLVVWLWRGENWVLRNGAIIGMIQTLWGLTLGRGRQKESGMVS
jgi:hypothetical protein